MCITIPSSANIDRNRQLPLWQWLIDSPIRLLSAGGGISICLGLLHWRYGMSVADGWLSFNLLYGVLPFFLFPQLLAYLPSRLKVSPLRYVGYGSLFFLMLAAQLVFYLSIILGDRPGMTYLLLTLMAWLFLLRVILNFLRSSYMTGRLWHRGLLIWLLWGVASGCMAGLFLISGSITTAPLSLLAGASYILPASLFYLVLRYSN
ncbi:MAG: hypothetical protein B6D77_11345 [gamma proteobacterium symbiont of Ctena orbiculata]|nr:MAG: hypothetical protein B6D77_11345 [gamma proteobacterium symbiont of Ctena orbiculata]